MKINGFHKIDGLRFYSIGMQWRIEIVHQPTHGRPVWGFFVLNDAVGVNPVFIELNEWNEEIAVRICQYGKGTEPLNGVSDTHIPITPDRVRTIDQFLTWMGVLIKSHQDHIRTRPF